MAADALFRQGQTRSRHSGSSQTHLSVVKYELLQVVHVKRWCIHQATAVRAAQYI